MRILPEELGGINQQTIAVEGGGEGKLLSICTQRIGILFLRKEKAKRHITGRYTMVSTRIDDRSCNRCLRKNITQSGPHVPPFVFV